MEDQFKNILDENPDISGKLDKLIQKDGREMTAAEFLNSSITEEEAKKLAENVMTDEEAEKVGYVIPTVSNELKAISKEAMKKLNKEIIEKRKKDPKIKEDLINFFVEQQRNAFLNKNKYEMRGQAIKSLKKRLSRLFDKGRFNKYLSDKTNLN